MNPDARQLTSVDRATRRYRNAVRQGSIPCRADGNSDGQTYNYRTAVERSELRFTQVKQALMERGVPLIQFVPYRNFALHVDKLFRDYSGESLRLRVLDAILRWKCYGCEPEVLKTICRQVFALEVG